MSRKQAHSATRQKTSLGQSGTGSNGHDLTPGDGGDWNQGHVNRTPGDPSPDPHLPVPQAHDHHADGHVHVMPLQLLFTIFFALIFFTIATVVISKFHLGAWEVPITMAIASTKAILVAVYFMHLRYDNPFNAMMFCFSLFFVALFLGGTLIDVRAYQKDLIPPTQSATP